MIKYLVNHCTDVAQKTQECKQMKQEVVPGDMVHEAFAQIDKDQSGCLSLHEVANGVPAILAAMKGTTVNSCINSGTIPMVRVTKIFKQITKGHTDVVTLDQFRQMLNKLKEALCGMEQKIEAAHTHPSEGKDPELLSLFETIDADQSGVISICEMLDPGALAQLHQLVGGTIPRARLHNLVQGQDTDGSGTLDLDELSALVELLRKTTSSMSASAKKLQQPEAEGVDELSKELFHQIDTDTSRVISLGEVRNFRVQLLEHLKLEGDLSMAKLNRHFSKIDKNSDGVLTLTEFDDFIKHLQQTLTPSSA
eukprot:TRINITY_DN28152_c0_g1_i2.p1 TRINITY_DN28152_c0_g1~~TRINITY_DN28152_c0_g1_i2.p1  ORF type:complete len:309 (-),score=78.70 TRINITY_DN28152_c0_g1_i2:256-1182(-)